MSGNPRAEVTYPPIKERIMPDHVKRQMAGGPIPRLYTCGDLSVMVGREPVGLSGEPDFRTHISISAKDRDPSWGEIKHIQNSLKPGVFFCSPMPPAEYWISIHDHCFHIWEIKDTNLIEQWRAERSGL